MKKIAEKLLKEGKINQSEFDSIKDMTREEFAKQAALLNPIRGGLKDVLTTLALATIGGAATADLAERVKQKLALSSGYEKMVEKAPMLSEYPEDQIKDYYDVVKTFSPRAAANPLVAGALVNKMVQFGGVDHKLVQDIANIEGQQKNILIDIATKAGGAWASPDKP